MPHKVCLVEGLKAEKVQPESAQQKYYGQAKLLSLNYTVCSF